MSKNYNSITNNEFFNAMKATSPNFANMTAKFTYDQFKSFIMGGVDTLTTINEFTKTALQFYLNNINAGDSVDIFESQSFGVKYSHAFMGALQEMYVTVGKPIDPKFVDIQNGTGPDPFMITKPDIKQLFFTLNFNYANTISISEQQYNTAFTSEYGISALIGAIAKALKAEYTSQLMSVKEEVLNECINSTSKPLKETQTIEVTISADPTAEELANYVNTVNNLLDAITLKRTNAYNRVGWSDLQNRSDLRILQKPTLKNALKTKLLQSAFNKEDLNIDCQQVILSSFGGLIPTSDGTLSGKLQKKYDVNGRHIGFETMSQTPVDVPESAVKWVDPNEDIIAIVADYRVLIEQETFTYTVETAYNPRNGVTTWWAKKFNGAVDYDPYKNFVVIKKKTV